MIGVPTNADKISNADIDDIVDNVTSPYGPLVRVTDVDATQPEGNQQMMIEFETAVAGVDHVWMTFEQLSIPAVANNLARQQFNMQVKLQSAKTLVDDLDTAITAMTLPHSYADYKAIFGRIRTLAELFGVHTGS